MSSLMADVESPSSGHKNDRLTRWVEEVAQMCKPERVHWCDGSPEEHQAVLRLTVRPGTALPLHEAQRPNSVSVRSDPGGVDRVQCGSQVHLPFSRDTRDLVLRLGLRRQRAVGQEMSRIEDRLCAGAR